MVTRRFKLNAARKLYSSWQRPSLAYAAGRNRPLGLRRSTRRARAFRTFGRTTAGMEKTAASQSPRFLTRSLFDLFSTLTVFLTPPHDGTPHSTIPAYRKAPAPIPFALTIVGHQACCSRLHFQLSRRSTSGLSTEVDGGFRSARRPSSDPASQLRQYFSTASSF